MVIIEDLRDSEEVINKSKLIREGVYMVEKAQKLGADEAEAFLVKGKSLSFDVENNKISFVSSGVYYGIGVRVIKNKRIGFCYTNNTNNAEKIIKRALLLSKLSNPTDISFPDTKAKGKIPDLFDLDMVEMDISELNSLCDQMINSARSVNKNISMTGGGLGLGVEFYAMVNSRGLEIAEGTTNCGGSAYCVYENEQVSTGIDYSISTKLEDIDCEVIGRNAAKLAKNSSAGKKLSKKVDDVIFTPHAFSSFMEFILAPSLRGDRASTGGSVYSERIGEEVANKDVSIRDDGTLPRGVNSALYDDEGAPSRNNILVENGVLKGFVYDLRSAKNNQTETTANAVRSSRLLSSRSYKVPPSVACRNLVLECSNTKNKIEDMIDEVESGILVYDLIGAHTANPASGDFSVNSSILFLIEKGELKPIKSAMISGNFPSSLKNVELTSKESKQITGGLSSTNTVSPAVWITGLNVTP